MVEPRLHLLLHSVETPNAAAPPNPAQLQELQQESDKRSEQLNAMLQMNRTMRDKLAILQGDTAPPAVRAATQQVSGTVSSLCASQVSESARARYARAMPATPEQNSPWAAACSVGVSSPDRMAMPRERRSVRYSAISERT